MLLTRFFRRRKTVAERIEPYSVKPDCGCGRPNVLAAAFERELENPGDPSGPTIAINVPATVDGALLATQIEHQLKRRGNA